jgi:DNA polymerase
VSPLSSPQSAATAAQQLAWLLAAGCDVPVADAPRQWLAAAAPRPADAPVASTPAPAPAPTVELPPPPRAADPAAPHPALACNSAEALLALLGRFPAARRAPPLLWHGAIETGVWVLVDRPDSDPVHRQTIDRMLAAIDMDWSRAALVSRLPWPTPGDGEPTADYLDRFTPVVERLAALAAPRHVLALGQCAAELAGAEARLVSSRGRWFAWEFAGGTAQLLPSIHPRTMAASKELKRQAFEHLKLFREAVR